MSKGEQLYNEGVNSFVEDKIYEIRKELIAAIMPAVIARVKTQQGSQTNVVGLDLEKRYSSSDYELQLEKALFGRVLGEEKYASTLFSAFFSSENSSVYAQRTLFTVNFGSVIEEALEKLEESLYEYFKEELNLDDVEEREYENWKESSEVQELVSRVGFEEYQAMNDFGDLYDTEEYKEFLEGLSSDDFNFDYGKTFEGFSFAEDINALVKNFTGVDFLIHAIKGGELPPRLTELYEYYSDEEEGFIRACLLQFDVDLKTNRFVGFSEVSISMDVELAVDAERFSVLDKGRVNEFLQILKEVEKAYTESFEYESEQLNLFEEGPERISLGKPPILKINHITNFVFVGHLDFNGYMEIGSSFESLFKKIDPSAHKTASFIICPSSIDNEEDYSLEIEGNAHFESIGVFTYFGNSNVTLSEGLTKHAEIDYYLGDVRINYLRNGLVVDEPKKRYLLNVSSLNKKVPKLAFLDTTYRHMSDNLTPKGPNRIQCTTNKSFTLHIDRQFKRIAYIDLQSVNALEINFKDKEEISGDPNTTLVSKGLQDYFADEDIINAFVIDNIDLDFNFKELFSRIEKTDAKKTIILDTERLEDREVFFSITHPNKMYQDVYTTTQNFGFVLYGNRHRQLTSKYLNTTEENKFSSWRTLYQNVNVFAEHGSETLNRVEQLVPNAYPSEMFLVFERVRFAESSGDVLKVFEDIPYETKKELLRDYWKTKLNLESLETRVSSESNHRFLAYLGCSSLAISHTYGDFKFIKYNNSYVVDVETTVKSKMSKNVNFLASSVLSFWVPQMIARFTEHTQTNEPINKAPLGVAMDILSQGQAKSPSDFLTNPYYGQFANLLLAENGIFPTTNLVTKLNSTLFDSEEVRTAYLGAMRYLHSFIDFYTKPLSILYNVLLNPQQYSVRENPYLKDPKALSTSLSIKPTSKWVSVYLEALKASQEDIRWSHIGSLNGAEPSVQDVERELELWEYSATISEYDNLFDDQGNVRFETFFEEASYRDGEILPKELREFDFAKAMEEALLPYFSFEALPRPMRMPESYFVDDFSEAHKVDRFSRKLSASIELFSKIWAFNIAPQLEVGLAKGAFFDKYLKGENPNLMHAVDLRDVFEFGVLSPGFKKILENKSVSVGDGEKAKLCDANLEKNKAPYYPIHYSMKIFPRVKSAIFGVLPSEVASKTTSSERLSLGAYISITSFLALAFKASYKAVNVSEFGPIFCTNVSAEGEEELIQGISFGFSATQQTGEASAGTLERTNSAQAIRNRLRAITRDYNICIGQEGMHFIRNCIEGDAEVVSIFDTRDLTLFACIYYQNGKLHEMNAGENCVVGANPVHGTALYKYRPLNQDKIASFIDFEKAQLSLNFMYYLNTYSPNTYGMNCSNKDFQYCASVVIPTFDGAFELAKLDARDYLPTSFVENFNEALESFATKLDKDAFTRNEVNALLPSPFFTEFRAYVERENFSVEQISEFFERGDNYFGSLSSSDVSTLNKLSCHGMAQATLRENNSTFDLDRALKMPTVSSMIEANIEEGVGAKPVR